MADHQDRLIQAHTVRWFVLLFGVPLTYAILRYHVFKGVEWGHFPLYIANKACSLPPISLVAFIAAIVPVLVKLVWTATPPPSDVSDAEEHTT
jgi:hypothetical protein